MKALVRYIHLNPLRSGIVKNVGALDRYRFAGHSFILGKEKNAWQSVNEVLALFGRKMRVARDAYREFVIAGIEPRQRAHSPLLAAGLASEQEIDYHPYGEDSPRLAAGRVQLGRQPDLVGGGLIRSAGGWAAVQSQRKAGLFQKSDERILGDGDFVDAVLNNAQASLDKRHSLAAKGIQFEDVFAAVSELLSVQPHNLLGPSKERIIVKARALCCYWAVRELGMSMSNVAHRLKIAGPPVSVAVKKGGKIISDEGLVLSDVLNIRI